MEHLPEEIVSIISSFTRIADLKDLRLVSRLFYHAATPHLFDTILLMANTSSCKRFARVLNSPQLGVYVKHVIFKTLWDLDWLAHYGKPNWRPDWDEDGAWLKAVKALKSFLPRTKAVEMHFSRDICGSDRDFTNCMEPPSYRVERLEALFKTLAHRAKSDKVCAVEELTIVNLANIPHEELVASAGFKKAMKALKELHLLVGTEVIEASPESEIHCAEIKTFPPHLRSWWLKPTSKYLTALTLYFDRHWGIFPFFELGDLDFPNLRYLALGNYVFGYSSQTKWLTSLTTLHTIILDNCSILYMLQTYPEFNEEFDVDTDEWEPVVHREPCNCQKQIYANPMRWDGLLEAIRLKLYDLKSFSMGCGEWENDENLVSCKQKW